MQQVAVQIGLFGGEGHLVDCHVVSAHFRVTEDGTEVFVGEHLRANRGRAARGGPRIPALPEETPPEQLALFGPRSG